MEQPLTTKSSPSSSKPTSNSKPCPPNPEEVLAHYESQGLDSKSTSLKAISDFQSLLLRSAAARSKNNKPAGIARKLNNINAHLAVLDVKLDSKPGFAQSVAIEPHLKP